LNSWFTAADIVLRFLYCTTYLVIMVTMVTSMCCQFNSVVCLLGLVRFISVCCWGMHLYFNQLDDDIQYLQRKYILIIKFYSDLLYISHY